MSRTLKLQIAILTLTGLLLGVSIGLYIAAAFIGPAIIGN